MRPLPSTVRVSMVASRWVAVPSLSGARIIRLLRCKGLNLLGLSSLYGYMFRLGCSFGVSSFRECVKGFGVARLIGSRFRLLQIASDAEDGPGPRDCSY